MNPGTALVPTVSISAPDGEATVAVEIAWTRPQIERGLMYRPYLPYDVGMLFVMEAEAEWAFYMRNTLIPLDIIYIARNLTVAGIARDAAPCTEIRHGVGRPSAYVLEVNGGWASDHRIVPGAGVRFGYREADLVRATHNVPVRSDLPTR